MSQKDGHPANSTTTTPAMRGLLLLAAILVFIIGIPLFLASTATETYFAWTIATPLTAAFLGASYWSAGVLEWLASRQQRWSDARVAVPAVLLFTVLTLLITLIHLDRFHFDAEAPITLFVTWSWLIVYAVVPILMVIVIFLQRRRPGGDPPRKLPLSSAMRFMLLAQAAILGVVGLALLLATSTIAPLWPWSLTPLTARAIGAWLVSIAVAIAHSLWENDRRRILPMSASYLTFVILQILALARFAGDFAWGTIGAALYCVYLVWTLVLGIALNRPAARR